MDFRHIFFPFFFFSFSLTRSLEEHKEKKQEQKLKRSVIHDKVVKKCLISRKRSLSSVELLKQLFNYLYLLKRL